MQGIDLARDRLSFAVYPSDPLQGSNWFFEFSPAAERVAITLGIYEEATRDFASEGHPAMEISGNGSGCNTIDGRFEVHELEWDGDAVGKVTATFEQHCNGAEIPLTGCIHYE